MVVSIIQLRGLKADRNRDQTLGELGLKVLRFDNRQVLQEVDTVIQAIYERCCK